MKISRTYTLLISCVLAVSCLAACAHAQALSPPLTVCPSVKTNVALSLHDARAGRQLPAELTIPASWSYTTQYEFRSQDWSAIVLAPSMAHYVVTDFMGFKGFDFAIDVQPVIGAISDNGALGAVIAIHKRLRSNIGIVAGGRGLAFQHGKPTGAFVIGFEIGKL